MVNSGVLARKFLMAVEAPHQSMISPFVDIEMNFFAMSSSFLDSLYSAFNITSYNRLLHYDVFRKLFLRDYLPENSFLERTLESEITTTVDMRAVEDLVRVHNPDSGKTSFDTSSNQLMRTMTSQEIIGYLVNEHFFDSRVSGRGEIEVTSSFSKPISLDTSIDVVLKEIARNMHDERVFSSQLFDGDNAVARFQYSIKPNYELPILPRELPRAFYFPRALKVFSEPSAATQDSLSFEKLNTGEQHYKFNVTSALLHDVNKIYHALGIIGLNEKGYTKKDIGRIALPTLENQVIASIGHTDDVLTKNAKSKYVWPVFIGDTLYLTVNVLHKNDNKRTIDYKLNVSNQFGLPVKYSSGRAVFGKQ